MTLTQKITAYIDKPHGGLVVSAVSSGPALIEWLKSFTGSSSTAGAITMLFSLIVGALVLFKWVRNTLVRLYRDAKAIREGKDLDKD